MANPLDLLHHCVFLHFVADHSQEEPEFCVIFDEKAQRDYSVALSLKRQQGVLNIGK